MPTFRSDVDRLTPYEAGRPIEEVAREYGVTDLIKLASNESPWPPFPEVQDAIARTLGMVNRYPDNNCYELRQALAAHLACGDDQVWVGGGSSELLRVAAVAVGGPGTSAVYAWPSFVVYRMAGIFALAENIEVPLNAAMAHDLAAMLAAIGDDTTVVYVCNPNNPTGTTVDPKELATFLCEIPERVLAVVDEAYWEFAEPADTMIGLALSRPNVLVTRTFSKVYGLAALRVGYAVGAVEVVRQVRKAQAPFTVSSVAQVAAVEALRHPQRVEERLQEIRSGRSMLENELTARGIVRSSSKANFVYFRLGDDSAVIFDRFVHSGVIVRRFDDGWLRVTVGTEPENLRFVTALDHVLAS